MNRLRIALLATASTLAAAAPLHARQPVYRVFQDWVVACSNVGTCEMQSASPGNTLWLTLRREAGGNGPLQLRLEAGPELGVASLRLDAEPLRPGPSAWQASVEEGHAALVTADLATAQGFLQAIRNGQTLQAGDGTNAPSLSLAGISAALLFLDDAQGRLDSTTALFRTGSRPAAAVPDAPPTPRLRPAAPPPTRLDSTQQQDLIIRVRKQAAEYCDIAVDSAFDSAHPLTRDEALVMIECWRGAYQSGYLLFRTAVDAPGPAVRLSLPWPAGVKGRDEEQIDTFVNADYAPEIGLLSHFSKGRGIADCGEAASWIFDGHDFQLRSASYLDRCSGANPGGFPILWSTDAAQ